MDRVLGLIRDEKDSRDYPVGRILHPRMQLQLPEKVDYTSEMNSEVKDQGEYPICVGCAVSTVREYQEQREYEWEKETGSDYTREEEYYNLSSVYLYKKAKTIDAWPNQPGTSIRAAMKVLQKQGVMEEENYPLEEMESEEKPPDSLMARWKLIANYYRVLDLRRMRETLENLGPFILGIWVFPNFYDEQNGVIPLPAEYESPLGGHAIAVVGYDDGKEQLKFENSWGCYSEDTEILTENGWKYFYELSGERIATIDPETKVLSYEFPTQFYEYEYKGKMHRYCNSKMDLLVTPNHKILYKPYAGNQYILEESQSVNIDHKRSLRAGDWSGEECNEVVIAGKQVITEDWMEFLGYFISEGWTSETEYERAPRIRRRKYITKGGRKRDDKTGRFIENNSGMRSTAICEYIEPGGVETRRTVGISQYKYKEKMRKCLEKLPFTFFETQNGFVCQEGGLLKHLEPFGGNGAAEKRLPSWVLMLDKNYLKILYDALMLGDGSIQECENGAYKRTYYTTSFELAGQFQELCLKLGYGSSIYEDDRVGKVNKQGRRYNHICYQVRIQKESVESRYPKEPEKVDYSGKVFCVEIPETHTVFVRRNGEVLWSGNSNWGNSGYGFLPYEYEQFFLDAWVPVDEDVKHAALHGDTPELEEAEKFPEKDPAAQRGYGRYK